MTSAIMPSNPYSSRQRKNPGKSLLIVIFIIIVVRVIIRLSLHQSLSLETLLTIDYLDGSLDKRHRIPRRIVIVDKGSDLSQIPSPRLDNTYNTIRQYHSAWSHSNNNIFSTELDNTSNTSANKLTKEQLQIVVYLNDSSCIQVLKETEPKLIPYFENESYGKYKADICRTAELYSRGGYYFDTDMQVVKPIQLEPHITFTSPFEANSKSGTKDEMENIVYKTGIFNSFIASAPKHPILRKTLDAMLHRYKFIEIKEKRFGQIITPDSKLGTAALFVAFNKFQKSGKKMIQEWPVDMTIAETLMTENNYPDFPRHGKGPACDYVVHNFTERVIYFYSRIPDASEELCQLDK